MNMHARFSGRPGFRIGIPAMLSAVLLVGSVQAFVFALQEPLQPALIWLINLSIERGHFQIYRVATHNPIWPAAIGNFLIGTFFLGLSYWLARWNYRNRSKA